MVTYCVNMVITICGICIVVQYIIGILKIVCVIYLYCYNVLVITLLIYISVYYIYYILLYTNV